MVVLAIQHILGLLHKTWPHFKTHTVSCWFLKMSVRLWTVRYIYLSQTQTAKSHHQHSIIWKMCSTDMMKVPAELLPFTFIPHHCIFITNTPASYAAFAEFVSVMLHLFPFKHRQASLLKQKWRGERSRKMKSMFTQLKLQSNSDWMGATNLLCSIDVLFISVNVVTLRGRIASLNKTGLWSFISGSQTQRHLRSLGISLLGGRGLYHTACMGTILPTRVTLAQMS